jgi:hypothetical protein
MTTDATSMLTYEDLFGSTPRDPDSLFDQHLRGVLDEALEEALVVHLLGSTFSRDEAELRTLIWQGAAHSAAARRTVTARVRIAIRRIVDRLEVLPGSLPALDLRPVPVRTGDAPALRGCSFEVDSLGPGRRVHISPAAAGRFALSLDRDATDDHADWVLRGEGGRMIMAEVEDGSVVFPSVGAGRWALERRDGDVVTASLELSLEVGDD